MNPISFMTANYVARQVGYHMHDWGEAQAAVEDYYRPFGTYAARFGQMLDDVCRMGFDHIDLWLAHLGPEWATDEHIEIAKAELAKRGLQVSSLAGGFGDTPAEFEHSCRLAHQMGTRVLGGMAGLLASDRAETIRLLQKYDVLLAIENHPEKTPAEVLAQIGDTGYGRIFTCIDTGIWGMHGYDAAKAVEELGPYIVHVHLKDVLANRQHSCRYGQGIVPLERCIRLLKEMGYTGGFSVEHEPDDFDPTADVQASFEMLKGWLK